MVYVVPYSIVLKSSNPNLFSPDIRFLSKVSKHIYIEGICSNHPQVISPCDCREPLNSILEHLLDTPKDSEDSLCLIWGRQSSPLPSHLPSEAGKSDSLDIE